MGSQVNFKFVRVKLAVNRLRNIFRNHGNRISRKQWRSSVMKMTDW